MDTMKDISINEIPSLTWNWMKLNRNSVEVSDSLQPAKAEFTIPKNICSLEKGISKDFYNLSFASGIFNKKNPKLVDGKPHFDIVTEDKNHPVNALLNEENASTLTIKGKVAEPILISFDSDSDYCDYTNIVAEEGAEACIIFLFEGNAPLSLIKSRILAKENSKIHLVKVQLLGKESLQLDDSQFIARENAEITFSQIELGGNQVNSGLGVILEGYKSLFKSKLAYICSDSQKLDMNHIVYHRGKKSECQMKVDGTLLDKAVKTYRGTIDFKNGCAGSKGNEMEEVLLLSPKALNKSIPVILCDEEDVEGEHGSTIGRLSKDMLFYMQSRGISEEEAEKILSRAKINAVADLIPDERVKEKINQFLDK